MKRLVTTAAALALATGFAVAAHAFSAPPVAPSTQSPIIQVSDGHYSCEWFTITTCSKSHKSAQQGANRYGGYVIDTDDIERFRGGFFCSVKGPWASKKTARNQRNVARKKGAKTAYIKKGCGVNL